MGAEQMADGRETNATGAVNTAGGANATGGPNTTGSPHPTGSPNTAGGTSANGGEPQQPAARPLDSIDRDILRILQTDGRASIRSVADRVHVSRANAYARINRLIDDGVIRGFSARVNHERAGQGASAYITLKIVQNSWRTVREQLRALPGAAHIALVSGDFDVLLLVHTPDNRTLRELVLTRLQAIPEVLSTRTLLVFEETDLSRRISPDEA
ncbi:Lrp/AsnC family transcriptional regulator [Streptomyces sp. NPDC047097]|uniref:Lrp/AsnC family transcriptional regulator n=1 Tax=Streptomyces sp. NPDC047097 TaxID=3155260 RepID=UPI0033F4213E